MSSNWAEAKSEQQKQKQSTGTSDPDSGHKAILMGCYLLQSERHEYTERTSEKPTELGYLNCCMSRLFESCLLTYLLDNRYEALGNTGKPGRLQDLQEPQSAILVMQKQFLCKPASSETMIASCSKNELNKT